MRTKIILFVLLFMFFAIFLINGCNNKEGISEQKIKLPKEYDADEYVIINFLDKDTKKTVDFDAMLTAYCIEEYCGDSIIRIKVSKGYGYIEGKSIYLDKDYDGERINDLFWHMNSLRLIDTFRFEKINIEDVDFEGFNRNDLNKLIIKYKDNEQVHNELLKLKELFENDLGKYYVTSTSGYYVEPFEISIDSKRKNFTIFVNGDLYKNNENEGVIKNLVSKFIKRKAIAELMKSLNKNVFDYNASYLKVHSVNSWASGHSGENKEKSYIFIKVINNKTVNYTLKYNKERGAGYITSSYTYQSYFEYYNKSKNQICRNGLIGKYNTYMPRNPPTIVWNYSSDPVGIFNCRDETPFNIDFEIKKEIIEYLGSINITSISKEKDVRYGDCYSFLNQEFEQKFCFDEKGLITYTQWGGKKRLHPSQGTNEINYIEKLESPSEYSPNSMNNELSYCEEMPLKYRKLSIEDLWSYECWSNLARITQNISFCDNIDIKYYDTSRLYTFTCYEAMSGLPEDDSICEKMKHKETCYDYFNSKI